MSYYRKRAIRGGPSYIRKPLDLEEFDDFGSNQFKNTFMTWQPAGYYPTVSALREEYISSHIDLSPPPSTIAWERPSQPKSPISIDSLPSFYESDNEDDNLAPPLVSVDPKIDESDSESEAPAVKIEAKPVSNEIRAPQLNLMLLNQLKMSSFGAPVQLLLAQFKGLFNKNYLRKFIEKYPSIPFIGLFLLLLVTYWIISCFASIIHFCFILTIPFLYVALFAAKCVFYAGFFACSFVLFDRFIVPLEVKISEDSSLQYQPSENPWILLFQEIFLMPPALLTLWMAAFNDLYSPEKMTDWTLRQEADDAVKISLIQYYYFMISDAAITSAHYFMTFILTATRLALSIIFLRCKDMMILSLFAASVALLFCLWAPKLSFFFMVILALIGAKTPIVNTYVTFRRVLGEWSME